MYIYVPVLIGIITICIYGFWVSFTKKYSNPLLAVLFILNVLTGFLLNA
jgi:hypothetical protein